MKENLEDLIASPQDKPDTEHVPAPTHVSEELEKEKTAISEEVDDTVERAQRIIERDNRERPSEKPVN